MPATSEIISESRKMIDETANVKRRPKTKDLLARERIEQGQVLPPMHLSTRKRLRTNSVGQVRQSMSTITNAVVSGRLDHDVGRSLIWMLTQIVNTLKAEREDKELLHALDRLQEASARLEKLGMANVIDMNEIRRAVGHSHGI